MEVRAGEPVGVAGIEGDGRRETAATRLRTSNYAAVYLRYRHPISGRLQVHPPPIKYICTILYDIYAL